jgi:hypothetical protein
MRKRAMKQSAVAAMVLLVVMTAGGALAAGCGEASTTPGTLPPTTSPKPPEVHFDIYLVRGETPISVVRSGQKAGAEEALTVLLKGPTETEQQQGISTAIPAGTTLNSYTVQGDTARADFSSRLKDYGGGSARVTAILNQITRTVMANDARVKAIDVSVEGVPAEEALQP